MHRFCGLDVTGVTATSVDVQRRCVNVTSVGAALRDASSSTDLIAFYVC